jgi:hypothetical protein
MTAYLSPEAIAKVIDERAKQWGESWAVKCPVHEDKTASVRIDPGRKATLVYCHAGCNTKEILLAVGLTIPMLYHDYDPNNAHSDPNSVTSLKLREMVRAKTTPTMRELAPAQSLEDVLWPVLVADPHTWTWVRIRWQDWLAMPFKQAMEKWYVVIDAICADLMVHELDAGYDFTLSEKRRLRAKLEERWSNHGPLG